MTNWTQNHVDIDAPLSEVKQRLVHLSEGRWMFNMHRIFPEAYPDSDPAGIEVDDEQAILEHTGSTRLPDVDFNDVEAQYTILHYETARAPNTLLLRELHKHT